MRTFTSGRFLTYALIIALPLWFGSCKKGDDNVTPSSIEGTYKFVSVTSNPGIDLGTGKKETDLLIVYKAFIGDLFGDQALANAVISCLKSTVVTFKAGGTITSPTGSGCDAASKNGIDVQPFSGTSTWKVDGNKLTITDGADVTVYDVAKNGNTMKLSTMDKADYDGDGKEETYTNTIELAKQ